MARTWRKPEVGRSYGAKQRPIPTNGISTELEGKSEDSGMTIQGELEQIGPQNPQFNLHSDTHARSCRVLRHQCATYTCPSHARE